MSSTVMDQFKYARIQLDHPCKSSFHVLPCSINYDGIVNGSKLEVDEELFPKTRFRGRPLKGKKIDLESEGYRGHMIDVSSPQKIAQKGWNLEELSKVPTELQLVACNLSYDEIIVWEHGSVPMLTDPWASKLEDLLRFSKFF